MKASIRLLRALLCLCADQEIYRVTGLLECAENYSVWEKGPCFECSFRELQIARENKRK